jgi:hypothetical protein
MSDQPRDPAHIIRNGEVGGDGLNSAACLFVDGSRHPFQPVAASGNEDQIIALAGKSIGIEGADAARCAGDDGAS